MDVTLKVTDDVDYRASSIYSVPITKKVLNIKNYDLGKLTNIKIKTFMF